MPRKVQPKPAAVGKQPKKRIPSAPVGALVDPTENPLSVEERAELKQIYRNPVFVKALNNVKLCRPPSLVGGLATALGGQVATIALSRIQGWELFEAALLVQTKDKLPPRQALTETFPNSL